MTSNPVDSLYRNERLPMQELSAIEVEIVEFFAQVLPLAGLPKSASRIFGLLYISERPNSFEEVVTRLKISSGSASQGLALLRRIGAVRTTYMPGGRRDYYLPETDAATLTRSFMRALLDRHLTDGEARLDRLQKVVAGTQDDGGAAAPAFIRERISALYKWGNRARTAVPLVCAMMGASARLPGGKTL